MRQHNLSGGEDHAQCCPGYSELIVVVHTLDSGLVGQYSLKYFLLVTLLFHSNRVELVILFYT